MDSYHRAEHIGELGLLTKLQQYGGQIERPAVDAVCLKSTALQVLGTDMVNSCLQSKRPTKVHYNLKMNQVCIAWLAIGFMESLTRTHVRRNPRASGPISVQMHTYDSVMVWVPDVARNPLGKSLES